MRKSLGVVLGFAAYGALGTGVAGGAGSAGHGGSATSTAAPGNAVRVGVANCLPRISLACLSSTAGSSISHGPVIVVMRCTEEMWRRNNCPRVIVRY